MSRLFRRFSVQQVLARRCFCDVVSVTLSDEVTSCTQNSDEMSQSGNHLTGMCFKQQQLCCYEMQSPYETLEEELQAHIDKIHEMAVVMKKAIELDEERVCQDEERIGHLELENRGLRELLGISREAFLLLKKEDTSEATSLSGLVTSADLSLRKS